MNGRLTVTARRREKLLGEDAHRWQNEYFSSSASLALPLIAQTVLFSSIRCAVLGDVGDRRMVRIVAIHQNI